LTGEGFTGWLGCYYCTIYYTKSGMGL